MRGFIAGLEQRGELVRFRDPVDPLTNLTAIGWKTYDRLGKASLFTNLDGFPGWQVCNQIITDRRKWAISLGVEADEPPARDLGDPVLEELLRRALLCGV